VIGSSGFAQTRPAVMAQMKDKKRDRLAELCSQALSETDPHELLGLFSEINDILWKHILQVQEVIKRQEHAKGYSKVRVI
jgi:crotonobetainyl-CoA:carnitine CoA-transferase CaiB-like acyl-CoA transferase